jgi:ligand-binding sensor domain-containing protein/serine phosphatase RsbU (regulator of sigma subunit)
MKYETLKKIGLVIVILLVLPRFAPSRVKFKHITLEQGLSQTSVFCILQDHKGFMWFGTQDGLNKYDGYKFRIYQPNPENPNSINSNYITCMCEDKSGVLWIGTNSSGLNRFNRREESFTRYRHIPNNPTSLSSDFVRDVYEDHLGILWIGTADNGLNQLDRQKEVFIRHQYREDDPSGLSSSSVSVIYEDRSGVLWIGTLGGGLNQFDRETQVFRHYRANPQDTNRLTSDAITAIFEDHSGEFWIGTNVGLHFFDRKTGEVKRYLSNPDDPTSLSNNSVNVIYEDHSGVLWIGTTNGLNQFNRRTERFLRYLPDTGNPTTISTNFIASIYEDRSGILWVGTGGGGINKFDRQREKFLTYLHDPGNPNSLNNRIVYSIYEEKDGTLWIGTSGGGLNRMERKNGSPTFISYRNIPNDLTSLSSDYIFCLLEDRNEVLWIGTAGGGLNRFNRENETFTRYVNIPNNPNSLSGNGVRALCQDQAGILWIGTFGSGINRFDPKTGTFKIYQNIPNDPTSLSHNTIRIIYEDSSGVLWIGTDGGGLNKFNSQTGQFTRYQTRPNDPTSLGNDLVMSIYEDQKKGLWIGTSVGLNHLDRETGTFTHYTEKHGLPNNVIYGILEDERGHLWLSTNRGLSQFDPRGKTFKNYNVNDGLQSNEFNGNSCFKSRSGEMFFGGINGLNAFYPAEITHNTHVPPIVITDFRIFNKPVPIGPNFPLQRPITETKEITLSYKHHVFSFEFVALNYTLPEKNQYAYMMEGFDQDWNYTTSAKRFASYTNLTPGKYVFRVKGSNNDGVWNEQGTSIKITITPPMWKTWWFQTLSALLILGLAIFLYKLHMKGISHKTRLQTVLQTARDAQMSIMPQSDPQVPGFDISGTCVPASEVGGDFFDYIWLTEKKTKFGIAIGDVSGKAMKAAMTAVMSDGILFSKANESDSIKEIMTRVNRPLYLKTDKKMFTALCLASLDIKTKKFIFTNAGLNHPLLKSDNYVTSIKSVGTKLPLGVMKNKVYLEKQHQLKTGDVVVFFTDGIPDAENQVGDFYGYKKLKQLLDTMNTERFSAFEIKENIIADVREFSGDVSQGDDITLVVVKVL